MGSLAFPSLLPEAMASAVTRPPELVDPAYVQEVLGEPEGRTEQDIDVALAARAAELGVEMEALNSRTSTDEGPKTGSIETSPSVAPRRARSVSTASIRSTSTDLTSQNSISLPATLSESSPRLMRRRSKGLSFSQYDKYLSQVEPNLTQPKFLPQCPTKPERPLSVFSMTSKISVKDLKRGIAIKLRWKKKPGLHSGPMM